MVGPHRGPARPPMAPQTSAQPHQQFILKHVVPPYAVIAKPPTTNYVNYLSVPVIGNGNYLAVEARQPESNGKLAAVPAPAPGRVLSTATSTPGVIPAPSYVVASGSSPQSHHYLIPKPESFPQQNTQKSESGVIVHGSASFATPQNLRSPPPTRPTNHQRCKPESESEDEGEEVRPRFDPGVPFKEQMVRIEHNYPQWLSSPSPKEDDKESTISSDEKVDHNEEGEETETAAEGEDSVTRCICNLEHDDGYMISCDQCYVWQHVACVLPETTPQANSLPDMAYLCDLCQPRPLDRAKARAIQLQRRKQIRRQRQVDSDDSGSSSDRPLPKKPVPRRRAEPILRKLSKRESSDGVVKPSKLLDTPLRSKPLKVLPKMRRDSIKPPLTPPSSVVARKSKLKRKFEMKLINQRRKSKNKEAPVKPEVDDDDGDSKRKVSEVKATCPKMRCRLSYTNAGDKMVVSTGRVLAGDIVTELKGKYMPQGSNTKVDVLFRYRLPKDGTEVLLDGSARENTVRYANRVCHPNTQLKHAMVKASLRLYLIALETLEKNQEITLPHGCVSDSFNSIAPESCGKNCTYNPKSMPITPVKPTSPKRRLRRTTASEESDRELERDGPMSPLSPSHSDRKMTREEKKIEQAMKIFAAMEKETARKREKIPSYRRAPDSDKESPIDLNKIKRRRRRRKRRNSSRKVRVLSGNSVVLSGDESDASSGEEGSSPQDKMDGRDEDSDAAGLLLALGGHVLHSPRPVTPPPTMNGPRDNSENDSSPSAPMSSACLLVAAAVGPLAPGFKFPKTKKGMANEYQDKQLENAGDISPAIEMSAAMSHSSEVPKLANISNQLYYPPRDHFAGKKRWLRWQPNTGEVDVPLGSPPCPPDNVTPLKKRRLARESLTSEPSTPELGVPLLIDDDNYGDDDSPKSPSTVGDAVTKDLASRVKAMQRSYLEAQGIKEEPDVEDESKSSLYNPPQHTPENLTVRPMTPPVVQHVPPATSQSPTSARQPLSPLEGGEVPLNKPHRPPSPASLPERVPSPKSPVQERRGRKRPTARVEPCTKRPPEPEPTADQKPPSPLNGEMDVKLPAPSSATFQVALIEPSIQDVCHKLASDANDLEMKVMCTKDEIKEEKAESFWFTHPSERNSAILASSELKEEKHCEDFCTGEQYIKTDVWCPQPTNKDEDLNHRANIDLLAQEATKELKLCFESWQDKKPFPVQDNQLEISASEAASDVKPDESEDKSAPARRKLSITEYLKRKNAKPTFENHSSSLKCEDVTSRPPACPSPASDDDISPLLMLTPSLPSFPFMDPTAKGGRFKVEPTELERQRENLNERLRREFGLAIADEDPPKNPVATSPMAELTPSAPAPSTNGVLDKLDYSASLPQSDIYPVGCSNPPNPFITPYPTPERRKFRK